MKQTIVALAAIAITGAFGNLVQARQYCLRNIVDPCQRLQAYEP
jgi:hypothetical protein